MRARGRCTVTDLAEASGVSPVSVRHHLANLQAEGLVHDPHGWHDPIV